MSAAHDYAERIRARLPRTLLEQRDAAGMSRYALEKKCGVSRDMIGRIEDGESIPTLHAAARLAHGLDTRLAEFLAALEDGAATGREREGELETGRKGRLAAAAMWRHTPRMKTLATPQANAELVGTYRTFGEHGPVYQVVGPVIGPKVHVVVVQTGEELDYPVEQALADPETK